MFHLCSNELMERFDPGIMRQAPAADWAPNEPDGQGGIFGDRAIGELVRAIVARLGEDNPWSTGSS